MTCQLLLGGALQLGDECRVLEHDGRFVDEDFDLAGRRVDARGRTSARRSRRGLRLCFASPALGDSGGRRRERRWPCAQCSDGAHRCERTSGQERSTREICHDPSCVDGRRVRRPAVYEVGTISDDEVGESAGWTRGRPSCSLKASAIRSQSETLAARAGRDLEAEGVSIVPMGGATNIREFVDRFGPQGSISELAGLCDEREQHLFRAALEHVFVCVADLEDELIRALGTARRRSTSSTRKASSRRSGSCRSNPTNEAGTSTSSCGDSWAPVPGRKLHYARVLVEALDLGSVPRPLEDLLAYV